MYYASLPAWAINGGNAGEYRSQYGGLANGQTEFSFAWAAGTSIVTVIVAGFDLTASEAQRVAKLAGPS